jgi:hypothetical protein
MAHDAGIFEQPGDIPLAEAGEAIEVEAGKGAAEILALGKDGSPAQPGLERLQRQLLEEAVVVIDRMAPFQVVIG